MSKDLIFNVNFSIKPNDLQIINGETSDFGDTIKKFVSAYNNDRYQESLQNISPPDEYHGR